MAALTYVWKSGRAQWVDFAVQVNKSMKERFVVYAMS